MPLETADHISELVITNPLGTDPKAQGDDHLRLIKKVLQGDFPNIDDVVTVTPAELNSFEARLKALEGIEIATTSLANSPVDFDFPEGEPKRVVIALENFRDSTPNNIRIRMKENGAIIGAGYFSGSGVLKGGDTSSVSNSTGQFTFKVLASGALQHGSVILERYGDRLWTYQSILGRSNETQVTVSGGVFRSTLPVDGLQFSVSGANLSGDATVKYFL